MERDRERWNERYRASEGPLGEADPFLACNLDQLRPGAVLDVACGPGANSLFLSAHGFRVTGVDISDVAVEQALATARERTLDLHTVQMDLEDPGLSIRERLKRRGALDSIPFDNIVIFNYKPAPNLFEQLPRLLRDDGILLLCTFNRDHHSNTGFPLKFCVERSDYDPPPPSLEIIRACSLTGDHGSRDGYLFRKKPEDPVFEQPRHS